MKTQEKQGVFGDLVEALRHRLRVIADRDLARRDPAGHFAALRAVSERIDRLASRVEGADPRLRHYLDRCSYDKALAFIEEAGG